MWHSDCFSRCRGYTKQQWKAVEFDGDGWEKLLNMGTTDEISDDAEEQLEIGVFAMVSFHGCFVVNWFPAQNHVGRARHEGGWVYAIDTVEAEDFGRAWPLVAWATHGTLG